MPGHTAGAFIRGSLGRKKYFAALIVFTVCYRL